MSSFELAIPFILKNEGSLVDDPNDPGGITHFGISLRFLKPFAIKYDFNKDGVIDEKEIRDLTEENAKLIYRIEFWNKYQYALIYNQLLANKIFDMAVNMGPEQAHKLVQRAVWAMSQSQSLKDDGDLGNKTLAEINKWNGNLLPVLRAEQASFYRLITTIHPQQKNELAGLLNRSYAL